MLTELQTRKLTRLFALYDVNGNGVIEREDYELVAHNTAIGLSHKFIVPRSITPFPLTS